MGGVSGIGAVVAFSFRLLQVPEAITLLIPILETIWPILAIGLGCGSLALLIDVGMEYDNRIATKVVKDLQDFEQAGLSRISPLHMKLTITPHRDMTLRTLGRKYRKLLGVNDEEADFSKLISGTYVSRAIEYAEVFRRYGYLRGRVEIRRIIAKSKQKPLTWWPF